MKQTIIGILVTGALGLMGYGGLFLGDARYVLAANHAQQRYEQQLDQYRRDANQLKREKIRAQSAQEKLLIQQQIEENEAERRDYIQKFQRGGD